MQDIRAYLAGTWLSQPREGYVEQPLQGSSESDIEAAEKQIGRKLPAAMKAWYRVAGKVPPSLNDHDSDFTLRDLMHSQGAPSVIHGTQRRQSTILPFSSRLGEQIWMVDTAIGDPDDPPVFHLDDDVSPYRLVECAFSMFIRETWLQWLETTEHDRRENSFKSKQYFIHVIRQEAAHLRAYLIEKVYDEDTARGEITGPREFQERWVAEFAASDLQHKFQTEELRTPFGWITPP